MLVTSKSFGETREGFQLLMKSSPPHPPIQWAFTWFSCEHFMQLWKSNASLQEMFFLCCASLVAGCQEILIRHPAVLLWLAFVTMENLFLSFFFSLLPSPFSSLLNMYKQVEQVGNQSLYVLCSHTGQKCDGKRLGSCNLKKPLRHKMDKLFVSLTKTVFYSQGKNHAIFQCKLKVSDKRLIPH